MQLGLASWFHLSSGKVHDRGALARCLTPVYASSTLTTRRHGWPAPFSKTGWWSLIAEWDLPDDSWFCYSTTQPAIHQKDSDCQMLLCGFYCRVQQHTSNQWTQGLYETSRATTEVVRYVLQCIADRVEQIMSVKLAITYVKEAWASVKQSTIMNSWRHVKILLPT